MRYHGEAGGVTLHQTRVDYLLTAEHSNRANGREFIALVGCGAAWPGTISAPVLQAIKESAGRVRENLVDLPIRKEEEIEQAIAAFASGLNGDLIYPSDVFTAAQHKEIIADELIE